MKTQLKESVQIGCLFRYSKYVKYAKNCYETPYGE